MVPGALLCLLVVAQAAPDVVFLGRAETRASSRSNAQDGLAPAFDLVLEPALQLDHRTRRLQSQLVLTPSVSARITLDAAEPVQPLFSQRVDGTISGGRELRGIFALASVSLNAGLVDVNTAEQRLGQPFGLNLGAGIVPLVDGSAQLTLSSQPFRSLRVQAWGAGAILATPPQGAQGLGDDLILAFTQLEPQFRPEIGADVERTLSSELRVGARGIFDTVLTPDGWNYSGGRALMTASYRPLSALVTQAQVGGLLAAVSPGVGFSVWPLLRLDATWSAGAPETFMPGGGSLGGGRSALTVSTGIEPDYDAFLVQVNLRGRLDVTASYAPSPRLAFELGAGLAARFLATSPPKPGALSWVSQVGVPADNGANQIAVLTARIRFALTRNISMESGIFGSARISPDGQTAPQLSVFLAFTGRARDDEVVDLVGDAWRSSF